MLTRQMRSKEQRRKGYIMKLIAKGCAPRFRNPVSNFKLSDSLYMCEGKLINPDDRSGCLASYFDFNRIVRCTSFKTMVKCQMEVFNPVNTPYMYVVERLRSFGDQELYQISNKIYQVCFYKTDYIPQNKVHLFPTKETILNYYKDEMCFISTRDLSPKATTFNQIYLTKRMVQNLGFTEENLMLLATKYGCLGIGEGWDLDFLTTDYMKQFKFFLESQISFKRLSESQTPISLQAAQKQFRVETAFKTVNKNKDIVDWKCTFITPAPNVMVMKYEYIDCTKFTNCETMDVSAASTPVEIQSNFVDFIQEEEISVLRHLIVVPENMLTINKAFVCNYRDIV